MDVNPIDSSAASSGDPRWYAVRTRPHQEQRAEANLRAWGVDTLLPMVRPRARARRSVSNPQGEALFPTYLFARFDSSTMAGKVRFTRGVSKILGTPESPSPVDDAIIEEIRGRVGGDGFVSFLPPLSPGDRVRITSGVLRDFVGVFQASLEPSHRLQLLLSAVQGQIRLTIDSEFVEKIA